MSAHSPPSSKTPMMDLVSPSWVRQALLAGIGILIVTFILILMHFFSPSIPLPQAYTDPTYGFTVHIPADYAVHRSSDEQGAYILTFEDRQAQGVQVRILPWPEAGKVLTKARLKQDIPDMLVKNAKTVALPGGYGGTRFQSDSAAFGGASEELWFIYRGNVYQLTTYPALGHLLDAIFATWRFAR